MTIEAGLEPIAIIGLACRFPGAPDSEAFWHNLREGVESITFFSPQELLAAGVEPALLDDPRYVRARAVLAGAELFDAAFFGFTPRAAEATDPQHRVFLECAWEALEHAGYNPEACPGRVGVYAGAGLNSYLLSRLSAFQALAREDGSDFSILLGNDKDFLATRVSYKLNLKGPSVTLNTACSTSLVTVQFACQALWSQQCDMALAGGVTIQCPQEQGYLYQEGGILSPDGHCRAFDAGAQGTVSGSGAGLVVLKRLSDALADGDSIHALIRGAAVNNDGADKVGYTAPGLEGQLEVIGEALALAGVDPATLTAIEAHGTGTPLGDPIEVGALTRALAGSARAGRYCALGSVKTNVGHLDTAAGVAGLIKTVLALEHRQLPPSLHFARPNPEIDFTRSPFYVNTALRDWPREDGTPRRAGVSSFGIGGTNAHVILEEAPAAKPAAPARPWQLLVLSARTESALERAAAALASRLSRHPEPPLADVAYTLAVGRKAFPRRCALVCADSLEAVRRLESRQILGVPGEPRARPVAFLFPGQGVQYPGMGLELYRSEPLFRELVDTCAGRLQALGLDLYPVLFPPQDRLAEAAHRLSRTALAQPALFVLEYALARLWMAWGIQPQALLGHSLGEYVAACLAGVFSLEDALFLVATRERLMQALPAGAMLAVALPEAELRDWLADGNLSLAAVNGPQQCVVSGESAAIAGLRRRLAQRGVDSVPLETSHAFHSPLMEPILETFRGFVSRLDLRAPRIPYLSNLTGGWIRPEQAMDPAYWSEHLRRTVRFEQGLATLLEDPELILLEVGPGRTLSRLALRHPARREQPVVHSLPAEPGTDLQTALEALGQLWLTGCPVDWAGFYSGEQRRRVPLPGYPFERQRYWLEAVPAAGPPPAVSAPLPASGPGAPFPGRFCVPAWQPAPLPLPSKAPEASRLVFVGGGAFGERLTGRLGPAVTVRPGAAFAALDDHTFILDPERGEDYDALIRALRGRLPATLVHLWSLGGAATRDADPDAGTPGFYSLLYLAKALGRQNVLQDLEIVVIADGLHDIGGTEPLYPEKATLCGPLLVIPKEYLNLRCRGIDIVLPPPGSPAEERLLEQLTAELARPGGATWVAYRGPQRLVQTYAPVTLETGAGRPPRLRERGVYLITGGLGGVGLEIARYLARTVQARLILTGRSGLPPRDEWPRWLAAESEPALPPAPLQGGGIAVAIGDQTAFIEAREQEIEQDLDIQGLPAYPGLEASLYDLCARLLLDYFKESGVATAAAQTRTGLLERLRIIPKFQRFFDFILAVLEGEGVLRRAGEELRFLRDPGPARPLQRELEARYPGFQPLLRLLAHCVGHYPQALSGEIEAIGVLFPDGGEGLMLESAKVNVEYINNRVYRLLLREILVDLLDRAGGCRLRILEVGGGNGILTGVLAPSLKNRNVEYHFTDLGKSFVIAARQKAEAFGFDFMRFGVLDIGKDPLPQGYDAQSFDLILGLDVVHATPDIRATVGNLRRLLGPGGLLCLLETVRARPWDDLIAGLAEGWWYAEDELRNGPPLLTLDRWEQALAGQGFADVLAFPRAPEKRRTTDCGLIIAQQESRSDAPADAGPTIDARDRLRDKLQRLQELESLGAEVLVRSVDVADGAAMQALFEEVRERFGAVHGVIHAAMDMRSGAIQFKEPAQVAAEFAPKVQGTRVLEALFRDREMDFLVLCSSVGALAGGFGDVGYCAACNFLDAFARQRSRDGVFAVAVNWDRWQGVGFALDYERWYRKTTGRTLGGGMTPEEGVDAFARLLWQQALPQIVVTAQPAAAPEPPAPSSARATELPLSRSGRHPRPALSMPYAPPVGETEGAVATVWQEVLNIEAVGRDDSFTELGGDSLIAIQVLSRLRERLRIELAVRALFEAPTVAELARQIEGLRGRAVPAADLEEGIL